MTEFMDTEVKNTKKVPKYWVDLDAYENNLKHQSRVQKEFVETPKEAEENGGFDRRDFMKLMGASAVMASLAGCSRRPVQKIVPYVNKPEELTPGIPNFYASSCPKTGHGLLVTTREGRPVKVDGNPEHPINGRGLSATGQAMVHDLYDPDRLTDPKISGEEVDWDRFNADAAKQLRRGKTYVLAGTSADALQAKLLKNISSEVVRYDSFPMDDVVEGQKQSFGRSVMPRYRFDLANLIVTLDADILGTWLDPVSFSNQYAKNRKLKDKKLSKLIAFESSMQLTGFNADERHSIHPDDKLLIALAIAHEVARRKGYNVEGLNSFNAAEVSKRVGVEETKLVEVARQLLVNAGRSLIVAGGTAGKTSHAISLQNTVNFINWALGNDGRTIDGGLSSSNMRQGNLRGLQRLISAMQAGKVDNIVIHGINPAYQLPKSLGFVEALKKVKNVFYITQYWDETAEVANFVAAENHPLESWGMHTPYTGVHSIQQPTIRPLANTQNFTDLLIKWSRAVGREESAKDSYHLLQKEWKKIHYQSRSSKDFQDFWVESLQNGFVDLIGKRRELFATSRNYTMSALSAAIREAKAQRPVHSDLALVLTPSIAMEDGSQANNAVLQELPDPISKVCWGNYLSISPAFAKAQKLKDGDVVKVSNSLHSLELPIFVQPGIRKDVVSVHLGYGRKFNGRVGSGVGVSAINFAQPMGSILSFVAHGVKLTKTDKQEKLASTQGHNSLEGRDIIFETTLDEYKKDPHAGIVHHVKDLDSLWSKHKYKGYRWGMTIDLNSCTGCSSCVVACSIENNVPSVGKDQVTRGREMHWIRVDRYYSGKPESPKVIQQPMLCQHCENPGCETVCPVIATAHSDEGLNQMIYNRCVGTRYCANNCAYKVRRFNFYEYNAPLNAKIEHPLPLKHNPEVTLRSRGVMEKCSFCVQRIESAKSVAKSERRKVQDADLQTACQQACPTDAITFGDVNNLESAVSKSAKNRRSYTVLEELNQKPSVLYQTRVWNREQEEKQGGHGHHTNATTSISKGNS